MLWVEGVLLGVILEYHVPLEEGVSLTDPFTLLSSRGRMVFISYNNSSFWSGLTNSPTTSVLLGIVRHTKHLALEVIVDSLSTNTHGQGIS